jgi:hypothetical protein
MRSMQLNVGNWVQTRTEENHGKSSSNWPVSTTSGCKRTEGRTWSKWCIKYGFHLTENTILIHYNDQNLLKALYLRIYSLFNKSYEPINPLYLQNVKFLSHFPYFDKKTSRLMKSSCCLYVCVSPLANFKFLNQSLWNFVYLSWHLSPSQRRTS